MQVALDSRVRVVALPVVKNLVPFLARLPFGLRGGS
jgi:hypothetical protein